MEVLTGVKARKLDRKLASWIEENGVPSLTIPVQFLPSRKYAMILIAYDYLFDKSHVDLSSVFGTSKPRMVHVANSRVYKCLGRYFFITEQALCELIKRNGAIYELTSVVGSISDCRDLVDLVLANGEEL